MSEYIDRLSQRPSVLSLVNPLDKFTTYSTHFVIVAARTTENAKAFMDPAFNMQTLDAIERTKQLGDEVPYQINSAKGDVYLVMDTRRFSQFTVQSMKYDVFINGLSKGNSHSNLATTIEMTVLDSVGISFINFLQWLMDVKLKTNFDGMIFMIRVIFVGHLENGTTETVQNITIPAHLFKMEVNLDHLKGIYTMEFMPNMNFDVNHHTRWTHIGSANSWFTGPNEKKLGDVIRAFEGRLNKKSSDFFLAQTQATQQDQGKEASNPSSKFGRQVVYQITIPAEWETHDFLGSWKHNGNSSEERDFKKELQALDKSNGIAPDTGSSPVKDVSVSVQPGSTITDILDIMFKQTPAIAEYANAEKVTKPGGIIKFYKHVLSVTSNDETVQIHVDVVPFNVPNVQPQKKDEEGRGIVDPSIYVTVVDNGIQKRVPKNYFELDYTFTGKNTQVLNFDMKMQNLVFLLAANVKVSAGEMAATALTDLQTDKQKKESAPKEILALRPYDPILLPMITALERGNFTAFTEAASRNKANQDKANANLQEYARNLSSFYAISPIQTTVKIKGNPELMMKVSLPSLPPHTSTGSAASAGTSSNASGNRQTYRKEFEEKVLKLTPAFKGKQGGAFIYNKQLGDDSYATTPVFVKMNIKGPNVDFRTNTQMANEEFATDVLMDAFFVMFRVTNMIENGVFTQDLELWSHNVFGQHKITEETERKVQKEATQ